AIARLAEILAGLSLAFMSLNEKRLQGLLRRLPAMEAGGVQPEPRLQTRLRSGQVAGGLAVPGLGQFSELLFHKELCPPAELWSQTPGEPRSTLPLQPAYKP